MNNKNDEKKNILKTEFKLFEVIIIILVTIAVGIVIGYSVTNKFDGNVSNITTDKDLKEFIDTYEDVVANYYGDIDKDKLINSAINGMMSELDDPYSMYMDEEITSDFNDRLYGNYTGIGAEISQLENGDVIIYSTFENSPAQKAGLKTGDVIKKVDGNSVEGKNSSEVSTMIKESKKEKIKITILRDNKEMEVELSLSNITLDSVTHEILESNNQKVGYITISIFAANTYNQFKDTINNLKKEKIDKIIIDVRNNSGGYLDAVTDMMELFLKKDKIIYQLEEKGEKKKIKDETNESQDFDVVVLINEYSASASEILAAAFQESYGAKIVGVNSYGKGTVQQTKTLETGGMLKYTTQKWLTPNGNWINDTGIKPDEKIEQNEEYYLDPTNEKDLQLQKALEMITK